MKTKNNEVMPQISVDDIEKFRAIMYMLNANVTTEIITIDTFAKSYLKFIGENRSSSYYRSVKISFDHMFDCFGAYKTIRSIGYKEVENFIQFVQKSAPKGFHVYLRNMKAAFNQAIKWDYLSDNYFMKVKFPKRQKNYPAYLSVKELAQLCTHISNDTIKDITIFAFNTGMRLNEITNLKFRHIDLVEGSIIVGDDHFITKGRAQRLIPTNDIANHILVKHSKICKGDLKRNEDKYVFAKPYGGKFTGNHISKVFKRACRRSGLNDNLHFHSLRHSFASSLVKTGTPLYYVKELLGHHSIFTTEIYWHLDTESLRKAVNGINNLENEID